jgi:hypothetical protein
LNSQLSQRELKEQIANLSPKGLRRRARKLAWEALIKGHVRLAVVMVLATLNTSRPVGLVVRMILKMCGLPVGAVMSSKVKKEQPTSQIIFPDSNRFY